MNKLSLLRVLPPDEDESVELLVDDHLILLDASRTAGDAFEVHFNEIPRGIVVDLNDLLEQLEKARACLIAAAANADR